MGLAILSGGLMLCIRPDIACYRLTCYNSFTRAKRPHRIPNMAKLTPAQARTFAEITEAVPTTPDKVFGGAWRQVEDYSDTSMIAGHAITVSYNGNRVYGRFNTATLKNLESRGLIRVHRFGGSYQVDEIEVLVQP